MDWRETLMLLYSMANVCFQWRPLEVLLTHSHIVRIPKTYSHTLLQPQLYTQRHTCTHARTHHTHRFKKINFPVWCYRFWYINFCQMGKQLGFCISKIFTWVVMGPYRNLSVNRTETSLAACMNSIIGRFGSRKSKAMP